MKARHQEENVSDITPLHILLTAMRRKWTADDVDGAVALAKVAAPYMHPKVPAARPIGDLSGVSDEELDRIERDIRARDAREGTGES
jgi:hypothetical protein